MLRGWDIAFLSMFSARCWIYREGYGVSLTMGHYSAAYSCMVTSGYTSRLLLLGPGRPGCRCVRTPPRSRAVALQRMMPPTCLATLSLHSFVPDFIVTLYLSVNHTASITPYLHSGLIWPLWRGGWKEHPPVSRARFPPWNIYLDLFQKFVSDLGITLCAFYKYLCIYLYFYKNTHLLL